MFNANLLEFVLWHARTSSTLHELKNIRRDYWTSFWDASILWSEHEERDDKT